MHYSLTIYQVECYYVFPVKWRICKQNGWRRCILHVFFYAAHVDAEKHGFFDAELEHSGKSRFFYEIESAYQLRGRGCKDIS